MKKLKKGFTLVELVIVIAVIAVLAAVLIPTFSGIVQKAKVSNDTTMVKSLNTIMTTVDTQGRPTSVAEAIDVVETDGIKIAKLTATANGYKIVYDLEQNRFALLDGNNKVAYQDPNKEEIDTAQLYKLWKIVLPNQPANDKTFSMFLAGDNRTGTLNISTGVEVGENTGITQINYTNTKTAQNVVINTNSMWCTLTINAPLDEVEHHGVIGDLNIIAVKKGTYSEFGRVGGIAHLTYGAIKVNNGAELTTLVATPANNNANDVVLEVTNGGIVGTLIAPTQDVLTALNNTGVKSSDVIVPGPGETPAQAIERTLNSVAYVLHQDTTRTYYASFDVACNAAATNDTVVVLRDYQYKDTIIGDYLITIKDNKKVTIDLNGKIINGIISNKKSNAIIRVQQGELTLIDSSAGANGIGSGALDFKTEFELADPWSVSCSVVQINDNSTFNFNSGKLLNISGQGSYGIDNTSGTLNMNGGYVACSNYCSIRNASFNQNATLNINGGVIEGKRGIYIHMPNTTKVNKVTINNTTINADQRAVQIWKSVSATPQDKILLLTISGSTILANNEPGDLTQASINNVWYEDQTSVDGAPYYVLTDNR